MNRSPTQQVTEQLQKSLQDCLGDRYGKFQMSFHYRPAGEADGNTVFLLRNDLRKAFAVLLVSDAVSPQMVHRGMSRAKSAADILGTPLSGRILRPIVEGEAGGLSYAVLPYCQTLSENRWIWTMQRALLVRPVLEWLKLSTQRTVREVVSSCVDKAYCEPLRAVASTDQFSQEIRAAAARAEARIRSGKWLPRSVLMHGDLWKGNILLYPDGFAGSFRDLENRFVVIDWPGSMVDGYPIYDLIRLGNSFKLSRSRFGQELMEHCRIIGCTAADAQIYLMAAFGCIGLNLEHFPFDSYIRSANAGFATLQSLLN